MDALTAVVVGHADIGESDRIIRFLTAEQGRVDLVARGARASRKRFAGMLELGNRVRVQRAKTRGLGRIADVDLLRPVDRARKDIDRIAALAYGLEVVSSLAGRDVPEPKLTKLAVVWLEMLEMAPIPTPASRVALEAKALTFAGLLPSLVRCGVCDEPLEDPVVFGADVGAHHTACGGGGQSVTVQTLHGIEMLRRTPLFDTLDIEGSAPGGWLLSDVVQHHIRAEIRSRALLVDLATL